MRFIAWLKVALWNFQQPNKRLMHKIPVGAESVSILVGQADFLSLTDGPVHIFCRFRAATVINELTEVAIPTRFLFLAIGHPSTTSIVELSELGRAVASLFNDRVRIV
jgi:Band 3 cytoplasmic domain